MRAIYVACLVVRAFVKINELLQCGWRIFITKPVNDRNALAIPSGHARSQFIACRWPIFKGDSLTKIVYTSRRGSDRKTASFISGRIPSRIPDCRAYADQRAK
jgi:hypothetical protein